MLFNNKVEFCNGLHFKLFKEDDAMALDVSSSQIYAGRYHHGRPEMLDLLDRTQCSYATEKRHFKDEYSVDTVTFSE